MDKSGANEFHDASIINTLPIQKEEMHCHHIPPHGWFVICLTLIDITLVEKKKSNSRSIPLFWFLVGKVRRQNFGTLIISDGLRNAVALSCDLTVLSSNPMH